MTEQTVVLVDESGVELGYSPRSKAHLGHGRRHLAFVTLLFNNKNEVLLQKRKHKLFDGLWDFSAISHQLFVNNHQESDQEASDRALFKEMGIAHVKVDKIGGFNYFAKDKENCENEYCLVLVGDYNGDHNPNLEEVYETKWIGFEEFLKDIKNNPLKYTPWAILGAGELEEQREFRNLLNQFLVEFEIYKDKYFVHKTKESKFPSKGFNFYRDLQEFMKEGKKLRGFLVYLGYLTAGGRDIKKILPVSLAFEILHSFFLIHDDVIDRSDLRRGKPTIHKKYGADAHFGESIAIMWGDLAAFEAVNLILSANFKVDDVQKALSLFCETILQTGWGEVLDIVNSKKKVNIQSVKIVNELKTARYSLVSPLTVGATFADNSNVQLKALEKFGIDAGLAYQLHDDVLGVYGDEKIIGKSILSDMQEGKNTILILKAKLLSKGKELKLIETVWGNHKSKMSDLVEIRKIIVKSGALKYLSSQKVMLTNSALHEVVHITNELRLRKVFFGMTKYLIGRVS